jgi:hypothetical protein
MGTSASGGDSVMLARQAEAQIIRCLYNVCMHTHTHTHTHTCSVSVHVQTHCIYSSVRREFIHNLLSEKSEVAL